MASKPCLKCPLSRCRRVAYDAIVALGVGHVCLGLVLVGFWDGVVETDAGLEVHGEGKAHVAVWSGGKTWGTRSRSALRCHVPGDAAEAVQGEVVEEDDEPGDNCGQC